MWRRTSHRIFFAVAVIGMVLCPILLVLVPLDAVGTSHFMTYLPAYEKYRCAICHVSAQPTQTSYELNLFGEDFKRNGNVWNQTLANLNSDRDRCSNGFELGDADGDGFPDQPSSPVEHSNPGDPKDCTIAVTEKTWGIIKELFSRETSVPESPRFP
ncbi:MAG: hypothetical protein GTO51_01515 [Candidatus Latescibacteria bacterium]|nr:hypothetical protein [Candidatus Latescibacterota bacterium]NIM22105.1 hypothetical protein [Candidatus Latescibacterota bacterium]NIM64655.1 hypothetical protein [Candidatus Latescibacterota bacterium]NIO01165.1 hypothetical protein [Candidatus Latescibacterota bacterium]NIO27550.1 hypothetical protein [Candidatus Latescibacterota bacterium]